MSSGARISIGFFFQAEDGIRDDLVTGVQTCALPIWRSPQSPVGAVRRIALHSPWQHEVIDRKSTRLNSSHQIISYAVFCLKKKKAIRKVVPNDRRTVQPYSKRISSIRAY